MSNLRLLAIVATCAMGLSTGCGDDESLPLCGNGVVESGEACDDGNFESGDGCPDDCSATEVEFFCLSQADYTEDTMPDELVGHEVDTLCYVIDVSVSAAATTSSVAATTTTSVSAVTNAF